MVECKLRLKRKTQCQHSTYTEWDLGSHRNFFIAHILLLSACVTVVTFIGSNLQHPAAQQMEISQSLFLGGSILHPVQTQLMQLVILSIQCKIDDG